LQQVTNVSSVLNYEQPHRRAPIVGLVAFAMSITACAATGMCWLGVEPMVSWVVAVVFAIAGVVCGFVALSTERGAWAGVALILSFIALVSVGLQFLMALRSLVSIPVPG
jgi:hypothetical protein